VKPITALWEKLMPQVSERTIGRLSLYRRLLDEMRAGGVMYAYSHQLAAMAAVSAAQVRRDLMVIGYSGSPSRGYDVWQLSQSIGVFLDAPVKQGIALAGLGNLGRAILSYFTGRRPNLAIVASFDNDARKVNRFIHGCPCYPSDQMGRIVEEMGIQTAIIAVPAGSAQAVADQLVRAGVKSMVNFAPTPLRVPPHVYVEETDITTTLEKVAYFARSGRLMEDSK
jgi:redox-sensing transcriptional repressor